MTLTPREVELVLAEREACAKVAETKRSEHQQLVGQSTEAAAVIQSLAGALNIAEDYVCDARNDQDQKVKSVEEYPNLHMRETRRLRDVQYDLDQIRSALSSLREGG